MVATVAACGSGDSSSNRNRNSALETENEGNDKIDCDAQWDPTTSVMTLCQNFERVDIRQKGSKESVVTSSDGSTMTGNTLAIAVQQGVSKLSLKLWTRNSGGELREAGEVEFAADTAATKTFSFKPDAQKEVDRELVLGYESHEVTQTVAVTGLTKTSKAKFTVKYRLNGQTPAQNVLHAEMRALDAGGTQVGTASADVDPTRRTSDQTDEWTSLKVELKGNFMATTTSLVFVISGRDGAATSGGQTGPRISSATAKVGENEITYNSEFDEGTTQWYVTGTSFAQCSTSDGALPCITNAPFDKAFAAEVPDAGTTTTVEDTTTTVEETAPPVDDTTTTVEETPSSVDDTTTTVEETTTTVEDTTTTVAESPTETIVPPLLVPREDCYMTWDPADRTFTTCHDFAEIKVAAYGADGRYVGTESATDGDTVTIPQATANLMRYAYYSVGSKLSTSASGNLVVSQAREWMTISNNGQAVTNAFQMEPSDRPAIRIDGYYESADLKSRVSTDGKTVTWYADKMSGFENTLVLEVNGVSDADSVTVPVTTSYTYRIFANNEFGLFDYVGGGVTSTDKTPIEMDLQVGDSGGLGMVKVNVEANLVGSVQPEDFMDVNPAECAGSQPILFTNPNSPSGNNRVTITLDSDCSSVNGILAVAVIRIDDFKNGKDFEESLAWWNVSSTRYSSRISETIYLPDGHYSIMYFNPDTYFLKGIDYTVDTGGRADACKETALRIDRSSNLAVVEGCDVLAAIDVTAYPLEPGQFDKSSEESRREPDIKTSGAAIELSTLPPGWWDVQVWDRQQKVLGGVFALCAESCDMNPSADLVVDTSSLSTTGKAKVTDTACPKLESKSDIMDIGYRDESMLAYLQTDADHAPRGAWADGHYMEEGDPFTGVFEAQFSRPGSRILITTNCAVDGELKNTAEGEDSGASFVSRGLVALDAPDIPTIKPENDNFSAASDISGASEVTMNQVGATLEPGEQLAGLNAFVIDRSLITSTWLKFTASDTTRLRLSLPQIDDLGAGGLAIGMTVYRKNANGDLGYVTTNMSLAQFVFLELVDNLDFMRDALSEALAQEFFVQKDATYYVQLVGISVAKAPTTLLISNVDKGKWDPTELENFMSSTSVPDGETTTTVEDEPATTSTTSEPETTTSAVEEPTATTERVTPATTKTTQVTPTTEGSPATTAQDQTPTTSGSAPDTSAIATTSVPAGGPVTTSTTPAGSADTRMADGMLNLIRSGSQNETVPVLAGDGAPNVEIRQDATSVTLTMSDLVASVSKSGVEIDPQARVTITLQSGRRVAVSPKLKRVTIPTLNLFKGTSIKVSAFDTAGKVHSSEIKINKTLKPLVKVKGSGSSSRAPLYAAVALLILALVLVAVTRYFRKSGAAA